MLSDITDPLDDYGALMPFIASHERGQAEFLGKELFEMFHPNSVVDFGCGPGLYLVPFIRYQCRVMGLDADLRAGGELTSSQFQRADLRRPAFVVHKFDLALCIETAEHLQAQYADVLVGTVARSANVVFWSAAQPGQGGQCHYNEQPPAYWLRKFQACGFDYHPLHNELTHRIARNPECQRVQWLIPNAMLLSWKAPA